jgi:hypothetical protein
MSSSQVLVGFVLLDLECFVDWRLSFCSFFYFGHCVVCPSLIYGIWLPLWYLQTLLTKYIDLFIFLVLLIFVFQYYEKKDLAVKINNYTNINTSHLKSLSRKKTHYMTLEIQVVAWDRNKKYVSWSGIKYQLYAYALKVPLQKDTLYHWTETNHDI